MQPPAPTAGRIRTGTSASRHIESRMRHGAVVTERLKNEHRVAPAGKKPVEAKEPAWQSFLLIGKFSRPIH